MYKKLITAFHFQPVKLKEVLSTPVSFTNVAFRLRLAVHSDADSAIKLDYLCSFLISFD